MSARLNGLGMARLGGEMRPTILIEGLAVYTEEDQYLGIVEEVLPTGSNAVHVVQGPLGEVLIPALADVVLNVDLEAGRMTVRLPPGLLD